MKIFKGEIVLQSCFTGKLRCSSCYVCIAHGSWSYPLFRMSFFSDKTKDFYSNTIRNIWYSSVHSLYDVIPGTRTIVCNNVSETSNDRFDIVNSGDTLWKWIWN